MPASIDYISFHLKNTIHVNLDVLVLCGNNQSDWSISDRKLCCLHFLRWRRGCIWSIIWTVSCLLCVKHILSNISTYLARFIFCLLLCNVAPGQTACGTDRFNRFPTVSGFGLSLFAGMSHRSEERMLFEIAQQTYCTRRADRVKIHITSKLNCLCAHYYNTYTQYTALPLMAAGASPGAYD